ncbi:hypothetical protein FM107_05470 [Sphingobacterium sp. JB170]|nr:hypothetical protein FM107_05470 [Sphingobacterium sp. JB170]
MEMGIPASQIVFLNFEDFELRKFFNDLDGLYEHIIGTLDLSKPSYVFLGQKHIHFGNSGRFFSLIIGPFTKQLIKHERSLFPRSTIQQLHDQTVTC